ncbi:MAG: penicillin acylase family protein [Anaerolineales bacterium]|nr:penicillin acylase family protein [Anaerolineales bacterium]
MSRGLRILLGVLGVILVLAAVLAIAITVMIRRPFPKTDGRVELDGLSAEVTVIRDEMGIPHIYAENEKDLYFAQGYVHAQDRFWQMEFWRHIGQGRISEIAGEATINSDKFIRTMGWPRMAQDSLDYLTETEPEFIELLEAYSAGVNAYIADNEGALSVNQTVLGLVNEPWEIEPWTPLNTIAWGVVMSDDLSGNWDEELDRARLIRELGQADVETLLPLFPYADRPVIAPTSEQTGDLDEESRLNQPATDIDWGRVNLDLVAAPPPDGFAFGAADFVGSNNWVVSGEHTDTGMPLLANDPHLSIQMPAIWYEVGLHAPEMDVVGFSFAGVPGVIIGHNQNIAWGVTNAGHDTQDLFIERVNPNNPDQYEFEGEWLDFEIVEETILVNGGEPVTIEVRVSRHGPIINEIVDGEQDVLAFQWTGNQAPDRIMFAVNRLNHAENYDEFREALSYWDLPSQNFVYADTEGNIAYQMPGLVPIRPVSNGLTPVPGWTGENEWQGWIPYEAMPALFNPEKGFIATANQAIVDEDYPYYLDSYWADGDRGQRINDMLEAAIAAGPVTAEDFAAIHFDSYSLLADSYLPLFDGLSSDDPAVQAAIERLRGWDRQVRRDSVPAALFEIFYMQLTRAVLTDDVGEDNVGDFAGRVFFHELATQPDAIWWDNRVTERRESREDILLKAVADTLAWFEENVGDEPNEWTWGSIHTATFVSAPLGQSGVSLIESMVNRGPFAADGSGSLVNANSWSWSNPAAIRGHVSMRMIVDMADFDATQTVIPTGQSGHPYNPHYDDMIQLWLNGEYRPLWFSRDAVNAAATDTLILRPAE